MRAGSKKIANRINLIFLKMSNSHIDKLLNLIKSQGLVDYINEHGDMDKPSDVVRHIFERYFKGFLNLKL